MASGNKINSGSETLGSTGVANGIHVTSADDQKKGMTASMRTGQQVLEVCKLSCDVDEHGTEWWQKLASFEVSTQQKDAF